MSTVSLPTTRRASPASLLAATAVLLSGAFLTFLVLALTGLGAPDLSDEATVPYDGQPHAVSLDDDRTAMIWTLGLAQDCTVTDATGSALPLDATDGRYQRWQGWGLPWVGVATFEPTSGRVEVSCAPDRTRPVAEVVVSSTPQLPPDLDAIGPWGVVPVSLALSGGLCLVGALAMILRGARRPVDRPVW